MKVRTAKRSGGRSAGCGGCGSDGALPGRAGPEFGRLDGAGGPRWVVGVRDSNPSDA